MSRHQAAVLCIHILGAMYAALYADDRLRVVPAPAAEFHFLFMPGEYWLHVELPVYCSDKSRSYSYGLTNPHTSQPTRPKRINPAINMASPTPQNHSIFDPWSSSSTGHQRSDSSAGSAHWRRLRTEKLARQFGRDTDKTQSQAACRDIRSYLGVRKSIDGGGDAKRIKTDAKNTAIDDIKAPSTDSDTTTTDANPSSNIFTGTTIYINGSTAPQISDHALKRLLIAHGANLSLSLARRSVSHVIVGKPASPSAAAASVPHGGGGGAGGGLAARKLQAEIQRSGRQRQVKVVCVEWLAFLSCLSVVC
jgi:hypothetical protein